MSKEGTWAERNREHRNYLSARTASRSFVRRRATLEDLRELKAIIRKKEDELSGDKQTNSK